MRLVFEDKALEDIRYWADSDRKKLLKILDLVEATKRYPFEGLGKPEPLKHDFAGYWSRRIDREHRIIYRVTDTEIIIHACRFHY